MGYLLNILIAVAALGLPEAGFASDAEHAWIVATSCAVPPLLGFAVRRALLRHRFKTAGVLTRALAIAPALLFVLAISELGWLASVERWTGIAPSALDWPHPSLVLVFAPFLVYQLLTIEARARAYAVESTYRTMRAFQVRMFLSSLAPIAIYFAFSMLVGLSPRLRTHIEEVALWNGIYTAVLLALLATCLPFVLRNTWQTEPVPAGAHRDVLELVAKRAGFRARELLVWRTGHAMSNAAIVGFGPRTRVVLFSDALIAQLDLRELAAVFAHEIGHAVRRHVLVFVAVALAIVLTLDWLATVVLADREWLAGGVVLAGLGCGYLAFGWLSRRCELEADLYSASLLGDPRPIVDALEKVGGGFRDVASWRHFSTARRVDFLQRAAIDPNLERGLVRGIRSATIVAVLGCVLALGGRIARDLPLVGEQSLRADLRLGRYATAAQRFDELVGVDESLTRLVARARPLASDTVTVDELVSRARTALEQRDPPAAYEWLALSVLRGRRELARVADTLANLGERLELDVATELGPDLDREWGPALRALQR